MLFLAASVFAQTPAAPEKPAAAAPPIYGTAEGYGRLLAQYVDEGGLVDYAALKQDRAALDAYLDRAAGLPEHRVHVRWPGEDARAAALRNEQLAFFINVYNARVLQVVIDNHPLTGLRQIDKEQPANSIRQIPGVFDKPAFPLGGQSVTLDKLENEIIRPQFREPRVHMALVCGARGCPPLRREPFSGDRLDEQLNDQARRFLGSPSGLRATSGGVQISRIFDWFAADFKGGVREFVKSHLPLSSEPPPLSADATLAYLDYDWTLNERPDR